MAGEQTGRGLRGVACVARDPGAAERGSDVTGADAAGWEDGRGAEKVRVPLGAGIGGAALEGRGGSVLLPAVCDRPQADSAACGPIGPGSPVRKVNHLGPQHFLRASQGEGGRQGIRGSLVSVRGRFPGAGSPWGQGGPFHLTPPGRASGKWSRVWRRDVKSQSEMAPLAEPQSRAAAPAGSR